MSDFNLIDEGWISVVTDYKGTTRLVGLKEFFENAHNYIGLAGDMTTQDFALMRFLLAILHTVFSRYDAKGEPYEVVELDQRMRQVEEVDDEDAEEYEDALLETWQDLWKAGKFPQIVCDYLEAWRDRFYLFDDQYPFYQITKSFMTEADLYNQYGETEKTSTISYKTINRRISETKGKTAIFSPFIADNGEIKGDLTNAQLARWLINYMGYTTTPDKTKIQRYQDIINIKRYDGHKGWLYAIGGIHFNCNNLYKTLLLNLMLIHPENKFKNQMQTPAWEFTPDENIKFYLKDSKINNLARLYTDYDRCIFISDKNVDEWGKYLNIIQLPILDKSQNLLENMTIWEKNKDKNWYPRQNKKYESLWRNFGTLFLERNDESDEIRNPGIINWFRKISKTIGEEDIKLVALGFQGDTSSSNLMVSEMYDSLDINLGVSRDVSENGWVPRIDDTVQKTKLFIDKEYRKYIEDVIRLEKGIEKPKKESLDQYIEDVYFKIDAPFRQWLNSINVYDNKDEKISEWEKNFINIILKESKQLIKSIGKKAYEGIEYGNKNKKTYVNIALAYNKLVTDCKKF